MHLVRLETVLGSSFVFCKTGNLRIDKTAKRKFSQCIKHMVVEFGNRDMTTYPESNIVEVSRR